MLFSLAVLPALAGLALWALGVRSRRVLGTVAVATLALTLVLAVLASAGGWTGRLTWSEPLVLTAALTPLSAAVAILVPAIALPVLLYASAHEEPPGLARLVGTLLAFTGGMELLVIAADFLTLLIGWELVGAASWALISHRWRDEDNPRAGLTAFVTTRLGDLGLILAAVAAFAATGSFAFGAIGALEGSALALVAYGVLFSAAAKSGQVPFAPWLFRAMAGPTSVSALLHAATMVAAGAYILLRLAPDLSAAPGWGATTIGIGLGTALAGGLVAVLQPHAKKLLAASTSAHYGLMFVAVGAGYPGVALFHLVAHAAFKALLFLSAGVAGDAAGSYDLSRMRFGRALPVTAALTAVGALALAGLPPLGAAWTKDAIAAAAGHQSVWLAIGVILAGGLSAIYAARFQVLAFGRDPHASAKSCPSAAETIAAALLAAMTLVLSALWLPFVHQPLADRLGVAIAPTKAWELVLAVLTVLSGLAAGVLLARRVPLLGTEGTRSASAADWLGLPRVFAFCAAATRTTANALSALDRRGIDRAVHLVPAGLKWFAGWLAAADRRAVDGGVAFVARATDALARFARAFGERLTDGIPEGSARLAAVSGAGARRLQTGLAHHYYTTLAAGTVVVIAVLFVSF